MRKILFIIPVVLLLGLGVSCATEPTPAAPAQQFATVAYVDGKDAAEVTARTNADTALTNNDAAINKRIDELSKSSGATNSYTKDEINSKFSNLISNLTDEQLALLKSKLGVTSTSTTTTTTTPTTTTTGNVTWSTNPASQPVIYGGFQNLLINDANGHESTHNLGVPAITPSGYIQPYTLRITNNSSAIQYVRPVITISQATTGGYYYGGTYPQLIYYNVSFSTGTGNVQGEARSNFHQSALGAASPAYFAGMTTCSNAVNSYCPYINQVQFKPTTNSQWILQNGWWMYSQTHPVATAATTGNITGAFPINISPSNANTQQTPSVTITTTAPALNGYGEYQMTPNQTMDIGIALQIATLQQCNLQIQTSVSARQ